jgi:hypothetical protein
MNWLFLLASLSVVALASECTCSSGTLSHSYDSAAEVFSANVLGTSNDGTALVAVKELFKGSSYSVNDLVYIRYSCGAFPVRAGGEGVFFTTLPSSAEGSFVTHLEECTRNGPITDEERAQLQSGIFLPGGKCTDPETGRVYAEGESFTMDCNSCVCVNGESKCTDKSCNDYEPTPEPEMGNSCVTEDGKVVENGYSVKVDCNQCTCNDGSFYCTEVACAPNTQVYCEGSSGRRRPGEVWETSDNGCTRRWTCQEDGRTRLEADSCTSSSGSSSSKFFIIGISLASAIVVVIMATVVAVIRNRIRARQARAGTVLLDDVSRDSDSDDIPTPHHNHFNNNGGYGFANTNMMGTQPFAYPAAPAWGGQPLATTPMVLMTQTGEPVVVQVAYM